MMGSIVNPAVGSLLLPQLIGCDVLSSFGVSRVVDDIAGEVGR